MSTEETGPDPTLPRVQMAFACEGISTDTFQRVSFNAVIEDLAAPHFPTQTVQFFAIFGFEANIPHIFSRVKVIVEGPGGSKIGEQPLPDIAFTSDRYKARLICGFPGITWPAPGRYTIKLTTGDRTFASFSVNVHQVIQLQPQPPPSPG